MRFVTPARFLMLVAAAVAVVTWQTSDPAGISNDGVMYLNSARHIAAGEGPRTDALVYPQHFVTGMIPAPETVWPPGFAAVTGAMMLTGLSPWRGAFVVSLGAFLVTSALLFVLLLGMDIARWASALWAASFLCLATGWYEVGLIMAEPLYQSLALGTVVAFAYADRSHRPVRALWLTGVLAAMAILVRYDGLFLVAALGVAELWRSWRDRRFNARRAVPLLLPMLLVVAPLLIRNYLLVGQWGSRPPTSFEQGTALDAIHGLYWGISGVSGLSLVGLKQGGVGEVGLVALVLLLLYSLVRNGPRHVMDNAGRFSPREGHPALVLSVAYVAVALASLTLLQFKQNPTALNSPRYLFILAPFVIVIVARMWHGVQASLAPTPGWKAGLVVVAGLAFLGGQSKVFESQSTETPNQYRTRMVWEALGEPCGGSTLGDALRNRVSAEGPILTTNPGVVAHYLGRPAIGPAGGIWLAETAGEEWAVDKVEKYGVSWVMVSKPVLAERDPDGKEWPFFGHLAEGRAPAWLSLVHDSPLVSVYAVARGGQTDSIQICALGT